MATQPHPQTAEVLLATCPPGKGPDPLLLTAKQASAVCGRSLRSWRSWDSAGRIPRPVRLGRATMWRRRELEDWIEAGCPSRVNWEAGQ
jgi:predicted DNA-binding transcriptional regulator AlpA